MTLYRYMKKKYIDKRDVFETSLNKKKSSEKPKYKKKV